MKTLMGGLRLGQEESALLPKNKDTTTNALLSPHTQTHTGVGGASRDSTGFVAMEEGLISSGVRNLSLPLHF